MGKTKDVRSAVEHELFFDPLVDSSDIRVENLAGDVALNGSVSSYPQYLAAAAAARRVSGVTGVHNHLTVSLPSEDYRDDPALTTAANNALQLNISVPDSVEAVAHHGNVTLTGSVRYGTQRAAAEAAIAVLAGVRSIKDEIAILWDDADPVDVKDAVRDALDRSSLILDDSDVQVATSGNTVHLTGHVRTWAEHDAAVNAAWMTPAVYDVDDKLVVTG